MIGLSKAIFAKQIILEDTVLDQAYLALDEDGNIADISQTKPEDKEIVDYSDFILAPGLVDTHIHGYKGYDVMDCDPEGIKVISEGLLSCGVTSFLPTTLTDTAENIEKACQVVNDVKDQVEGAKIQGIFLEGPFFTEEHKGAQNPAYMGDPSTEKLKTWSQASGGLVKKIAIAPERDGVVDFIQDAKEHGIHTALAHSDATYDQAKAAVDAGADIFIHTFNGMRGLHHREPGMVGAALSLDNVFAEVISDGHHVHPAAIKIIVKSRGAEETVLVTDCMRAGGLGEGKSRLGEFPVIVKDGAARLESNGSLAGSVLELIQSVQNLVEWDLASLPDAIRMASLAPAKSVDIDDVCGKLAPGYPGDFIIIDEKANLKATYLDGKLAYESK